MGANIPRRNHYISEFLLNNLCDDDGRLWAGDRLGREPFIASPKRLFVKTNLYASTNHDESAKTYENEHALHRIENEAKPAVSALIEQARRGCIPRLSTEDNDRLKRFIAAQMRRTPESQEGIGLTEAVDEIFPEAVSLFRDKYGLSMVDEDWYEESSLLKLKERYKSDLPGYYAAGTHHLLEEETEQFCRERGWLVAVIGIPNRSFVIGSHGITIVTENGRPRSWLPIAHDMAIEVTPYPDSGYFLPLDRNTDSIIRTINRSTVAVSRFIAGRSEALIKSLMGGYWKRSA